MAKIIIRNVGPIKEAEFDLNKVNVFMGPQSSGKSTIAKIISYCTWVEKDVATSQSLKTYQDNKTHFRDHLVNFHKIKGYFRDDSFIYYKSDVIEIKWESQLCEIKWVDQYAYKRSKISYIPSERNIVTLKEMEQYPFDQTNIRSFLFDWFKARKNYNSEHRLKLLNLGVEYYLIDGTTKEDHISSGNDYDIHLSDSSSGLQSIAPLVAVADYSTNWIYNIQEEISYEKKEKLNFVLFGLALDLMYYPFFKYTKIPEVDKFEEDVKVFSSRLAHNDKIAQALREKYDKVKQNLTITQNSNIIAEEPEQNLFPETQKELIYHLLNKITNDERDHKLTMTTHSPYILYALNNCMLGYLVKDNMPEDEKAELLSKNSWIDPKLVSVWEIEEGKGTIRPIKNTETGTISKHYFNGIMNEVMEEYYDMLTYFKSRKS